MAIFASKKQQSLSEKGRIQNLYQVTTFETRNIMQSLNVKNKKKNKKKTP